MRLDKLAENDEVGPYVLRQRLGKGGFAPVWLADERFGGATLRQVAIKLFSTGGTQDAATGFRRANILDEARSLCAVEHPNIVRFYTLHDGDPIVGLVMEHVAGVSVEAMLRDARDGSGKLATDEVLRVGLAIASALAAVHQVGLIHRDVKPANVVRAGGQYKLIDFGIASASRPKKAPKKEPTIIDGIPIGDDDDEDSRGSASHISASGSKGYAAGSLGYIDPAVVHGEEATTASDLYSLGATLYRCLTGELPARTKARLAGEELFDDDVLKGDARAVPLREVEADVPEALAAVVDALLSPTADGRTASAEAVAWELSRIVRARAGRDRPLPPEDEGPFRGLGRFESQDRDVYFGRTADVAAAVEMLRSKSVVALIGASGSGKSSLARAGILPAVVDGALDWPKEWTVALASPGSDPKAALLQALAPIVPDTAQRSPEAIVAALVERVRTRALGTVLLIDQLEEIVTVADRDGQDFVVRLLTAIGTRPSPGVRVLVTAREDMNAALLGLGGQIAGILQRGTIIVTPISDATWQDVIDQALACYGYTLEDDTLRKELLADLSGKVEAMPLVQFALTALWNRRDKAKKRIGRAAYVEIGGISGALSAHADATLRKIGDDATARDILLSMTTAEGTRSALDRAEAARRFPGPVLAELERARLVVGEGKSALTLAHEALIREWKTLAGWIDEQRDDRKIVRAVTEHATDWRDAGKDADHLWTGNRLTTALDLHERRPAMLTADATEFLVAGEAANLRHHRVVLRTVIGVGLVVLLAIGVAAGDYVMTSKREARRQSELSDEKDRRATAALEQARITQQALDQAKAALDAESAAKKNATAAEGKVQAISQQNASCAAERDAAEKAKADADEARKKLAKSSVDADRACDARVQAILANH